MITRDMRYYDYYTIGSADEYGQVTMPTDTPKGKIKMCINISSQSAQDNVLYKNCSYIGLTNGTIDDNYIIDYNGQLLKVLYVNPIGRYKQVFMEGMTNG